MPVIDVDYNDKVVSEGEARLLSNALQRIVSEATEIDDVNVYANTAHIKVNVLPIEVFIRMSASAIRDEVALADVIAGKLREWKAAESFKPLVNIYLIPMSWKVVSGI